MGFGQQTIDSFAALRAAIIEIEMALPATVEIEDLAYWKEWQDAFRSEAARLISVAELLAQASYEAVPPGRTVTIHSGRSFRRTGKKSRKDWKTDDLLRAVLDSRRFDRGTGELVEETPMEKLLTVWNLGAPRVTALEERGIEPDDFCEVEWSGRNIKEVDA